MMIDDTSTLLDKPFYPVCSAYFVTVIYCYSAIIPSPENNGFLLLQTKWSLTTIQPCGGRREDHVRAMVLDGVVVCNTQKDLTPKLIDINPPWVFLLLTDAA